MHQCFFSLSLSQSRALILHWFFRKASGRETWLLWRTCLHRLRHTASPSVAFGLLCLVPPLSAMQSNILYVRGIPPPSLWGLIVSKEKNDCCMLFWSSPTPGTTAVKRNHPSHGELVVLTHTIFNTFFPHFRIHLSHCLVHLWVTSTSKSFSVKTLGLMQAAAIQTLLSCRNILKNLGHSYFGSPDVIS